MDTAGNTKPKFMLFNILLLLSVALLFSFSYLHNHSQTHTYVFTWLFIPLVVSQQLNYNPNSKNASNQTNL